MSRYTCEGIAEKRLENSDFSFAEENCLFAGLTIIYWDDKLLTTKGGGVNNV
ncbi:hypothetical protein KSD_84140 [Ktedonobacter sp. SOSP1-85]|nr:hypothetical protein KSD_84140 [Ktedonobacter sp. SOSP1-85]